MNFKMYHGYKVWDNGMVCGKRGTLMNPHLGKGGYLLVDLYFNGKGHTYTIHSLMGKLFLPNFDGKPTIDHKDQKKTNNSLYNLKWEIYRGQSINQGMRCTNTSGVTGVFYNKKSNTWRALISTSEYKKKTKSFKTKLEANAQRIA